MYVVYIVTYNPSWEDTMHKQKKQSALNMQQRIASINVFVEVHHTQHAQKRRSRYCKLYNIMITVSILFLFFVWGTLVRNACLGKVFAGKVTPAYK